MKDAYDLDWPHDPHPLDIEFAFIKAGGYIVKDGVSYGKGKFYHYRQAMTLLWPEDDHHRWSDLVLRRKCEEDILVLMGSGDSNKTYSSARYILTNYWADPERTLWLVSSTEMRGAELRIWGKIKELFNRARDIHPWLAGSVIDSRTCITTDRIDRTSTEARALTKGVVFIPCKRAENYVGLGCFPGGTPVQTASGPVRIENISQGDLVTGLTGECRVNACMTRIAPQLARLRLSSGAILDCTPEHLILTEFGWQRAIDINPQTKLISPRAPLPGMRSSPAARNSRQHEILLRAMQAELMVQTLQGVREGVCAVRTAGPFPQSFMRGGVEDEDARSKKTHSGGKKPNRFGRSHQQGDTEQPEGACAKAQAYAEDRTADQEIATAGAVQRTVRRDQGGADTAQVVRQRASRPRDCNRQKFQVGAGANVPSRPGVARDQIGGGSRRALPRREGPEGQGSSARCVSCGFRVESVALLQPAGDPRYDKGAGGYRVYDLEIEGFPAFCVSGAIVHNSYAGIKPPKDGRLGHCGDEVSFMERSFLQAYANWFGKANFEGILQGNITDTEDPLGVAGEPLEGWSEWQDTGKTQEWRSKWYGAWVIALDGRDSPNFDPPQTSKPRFPYLINAKKLEAVAQTEGADSPLFWMQCVGKPQPGAEKLKVITRQLCEQNKAFEKVIWQGTTITDVLGLDAAYGGEGGDRCVLERIRFGLDVTGQNVIQCFPKQLVPVNSRLADTPETQIVRWVMKFAEGFNIPPEHLFFDGRSKLAVEFGRIWSSQVNAIDFGGPATDRPVSDDHYVYDEEKKQRRHKRCNEHYSKFVTELWFAIYYLIKGQQLRELPMDIAEEGWKRIWKMTKGNPPRIEVESKVDMKKRTTRSPDLFDALCTAVEGARRIGFIIKNLKMAKAALEEDDEWLERANQRYRNFIKRHELNYQ